MKKKSEQNRVLMRECRIKNILCLCYKGMYLEDEINAALDKMILSASGWRGIFAHDGDEESNLRQISGVHRIICAAAAFVFSEFLIKSFKTKNVNPKAVVLIGSDTRPTGNAVIEAMITVLLKNGCDVKYGGVLAAPEIMAWARSYAGQTAGFIYVSASHNPVGHNGIKFGFTDGGVLAADESGKLIESFREFINNDDNITMIESCLNSSLSFASQTESSVFKKEAFNAYYDFCEVVMKGGDSSSGILGAIKDGLTKNPLGIVCDFNGSARTVSIDRDFFRALGLGFESINNEPGKIAHRIVPEGESLDPCARLLEEAHSRNASFALGYVPDCDGDRGNLVIWDDALSKARTLEAQEVFALACAAELSHLVWTGELSSCKTAVAVNDPTSMRIDSIAEAFNVSVFRAEVGEANVVSLARKLRGEGYLVRILGEGSAGGNITHPSSVRDPVNTVLAIVKMLSVRSIDDSGSMKPGLFEIWCKHSNQMDKYAAVKAGADFTLADIIASLPSFTSTPAYSKDAVLRIKSRDHAMLKERYQKIFLMEWEKRKSELKNRFGISGWEAIAYNEIIEKRNLVHFGEAGKGGLKILFSDDKGMKKAYIWMRGSATEPVFRIMADIEGLDQNAHRFLLDWQRKMIMEADSN